MNGEHRLADALNMFLFQELSSGNEVVQEWRCKQSVFVLLKYEFIVMQNIIPVYIKHHREPGVTQGNIWFSSYEDTRYGHWLMAGGGHNRMMK